jgi:hypothetical protein
MTVDELRAILNNPAIPGKLTVMVPDDMSLPDYSEARVASMAKDGWFTVEQAVAKDAEYFYIGHGI